MTVNFSCLVQCHLDLVSVLSFWHSVVDIVCGECIIVIQLLKNNFQNPTTLQIISLIKQNNNKFGCSSYVLNCNQLLPMTPFPEMVLQLIVAGYNKVCYLVDFPCAPTHPHPAATHAGGPPQSPWLPRKVPPAPAGYKEDPQAYGVFAELQLPGFIRAATVFRSLSC